MDERGSVILNGEITVLCKPSILSLSLLFHASLSIGTGRSFCRTLTLTAHLNLQLSYSSR